MRRISRKEAKNQNLKFYFTGKPCKCGHIAERYVSSKSCVECEREKQKTFLKGGENHEEYRKRQEKSLYKKIYRALELYDFKCEVCGEEDIVLLSWHHRDGREYRTDDYRRAITQICNAGRRVDNISLVCQNCHIYEDIIDGTAKRGYRLMDIAEQYGFVDVN